jgi:hypothetical protein
MQSSTSSYGLATLVLLVSSLPSQEVFGRWESSGPATAQFFVSPAGMDIFPGTQALPVRSIRAGLLLAAGAGMASTLNVAPGTYDEPNGEVFPLVLPAHGVAIEAYPTGARPVVDTTTSMSATRIAFQVTGLGNEAEPDSEIRALHVMLGSGWTGVNIATDGIGQTTPSKVLVTDCRFESGSPGAVGVEINVTDEGVAAHRIIYNVFAGEPQVSAGFAVRETQRGEGASSTVMRSNQAWRWEFTYRGIGADETVFQPRLMSNFFQHSEVMLDITNAEAWLLNNTFAYVTPFSAAIVPLTGLQMSNSTVHLHNTIHWMPTFPGYTTVDFVNFGSTLDAVSSNFLSAGGPPNFALNPVFVGWPFGTHPGSLVWINLHLSALSPMIGLGDPTLVDPFDAIAVGALTVRKDVACDVDLDPRLHPNDDGVIVDDIGGDQVHTERIVPAAGANPVIDPFGNLLPASTSGGVNTYATQVTITGAPGAGFVMVLGFGFFDTVLGAENDAQFQNTLIAGLGSWQLGFGALESATLFTGTIGGGGSTTVPIPLGSLPAGVAYEVEAYLQVAQVGPGTRNVTTNRQRLELNW